MMPYKCLKHVVVIRPVRLLLRVNVPLTLPNPLQTVVIVTLCPELLNALFRLFSISFKNEIVLITVEFDW